MNYSTMRTRFTWSHHVNFSGYRSESLQACQTFTSIHTDYVISNYYLHAFIHTDTEFHEGKIHFTEIDTVN